VEPSLEEIEAAWRVVLSDLNDMDKPTVLSCVSMRAIQCMDEAGLAELACLAIALLPDENSEEREDS